ncbi:MAG TPA: hypothetical protein VFW08_12015 [bacterium]|nr:hypothetical protein [bacterium]
MSARAARRGERGITLIELVVAVGVFAMFIVLIDAVFIGTNRSSRKAELAVDVQQNARIAAERIAREIRESGATEVAVGATSPSVVFRSARLQQDSAKFCLYVRATTDPLYDSRCFSNVGVTAPPYSDPEPLPPRGTYTPIWQRWIGYYAIDPESDGTYELRRVEGNLASPSDALPSPDGLTGGNAVATHIEAFDVTLDVSGARVTVTLKAKGREIVQGSDLPPQEMRLPGQVQTRN